MAKDLKDVNDGDLIEALNDSKKNSLISDSNS